MPTDTSEWVGTALCEGRYRVLRKLGEGGMAHVYAARDDKLERDVVIKVPRASLIHDATFAGRFTREVRSLAKLAHPHIVPLIDIGHHDGVPFAVMHYLTGGSLRDRQPRGADGKAGPMPIDDLYSWLPPIAQALDFVHKNKYVHLDVKPENILFDEEGQVFLSDLGIVKALTEQQDSSLRTAVTGAGMVLGTPHYMAPELILGEAVDGRVDQYALGVTIYEMLTGQFPFNGSSAPAIFIQQTTKPPPPLRDVLPKIPLALAAAVEKALSKAARERFGTCVEFAQAAIGAGGSGAHVPTLMEKRGFKDPVVATLLEVGATQKETLSDLKRPTDMNTAPAPVPASWHAGGPAHRKPGSASRRWLLTGFAVVCLGIAIAAGVIWSTAATASELKLAEVKALTLLPGEKQPIRVAIERQRLDGEVSCWLEGLPDGIKADRLLLAAGSSDGAIDLAIPADARPRSLTATLKAKCQNVETSRPVEITINAPLASLRFFSIAPRTVHAGETTTVLLHVERKYCEGAVALSLDGLPAGVTWIRPSFSSPIIPADRTSYPLELKAAPEANAALGAKVVVNGRVKSVDKAIDAAATLQLTVIPAPSTPKDVKPIDVVKEPMPKPPEPKPNETKVEPIKPQTPAVVPAGPPELILVGMLDIVLQPGERKTVWVQIERKNCAGPVDVGISGLPAAGGITVAPSPNESIAPTRLAVSFDFIADASAPPSKTPISVTAGLKDLRPKTYFNLIVPQKSPAPVVKKNSPQANGEPLWRKDEKLTESDPLDRVRTESRSKSFPVFLKAGVTYTIDMVSDAFDSYVRLENGKNEPVAADNDSGGGTNARITYTAQTDGRHYLVATSFTAGSLGPFMLTVR